MWFSDVAIGHALVITGLVAVEVTVFTLRTILSIRGSKTVTAAFGALGALLYIVAISRVVASPDDPLSVAAYAAGVGLGAFIGRVVEERAAVGNCIVRVVVPHSGTDLCQDLRARDWAITRLTGEGHGGEVELFLIAVRRRDVAALLGDVAQSAPDAFWAVDDVRSVRTDALPQRRTRTPRDAERQTTSSTAVASAAS